MTEFVKLANEYGGIAGWIALAITLIAISFGFLSKHFQGVSLEKMLRDPPSWDDLAARYRIGSSGAYFASLGRVLGFFDHWYGDKRLSLRAYGVSLTLAYVYPFVALLFGWMMFNIWEPAGLSIFQDIPSGFERSWRSGAFVAAAVIAVVIARNAENFS